LSSSLCFRCHASLRFIFFSNTFTTWSKLFLKLSLTSFIFERNLSTMSGNHLLSEYHIMRKRITKYHHSLIICSSIFASIFYMLFFNSLYLNIISWTFWSHLSMVVWKLTFVISTRLLCILIHTTFSVSGVCLRTKSILMSSSWFMYKSSIINHSSSWFLWVLSSSILIVFWYSFHIVSLLRSISLPSSHLMV